MWGGAVLGAGVGGGISYARSGDFWAGAGIGSDIGSLAGSLAGPAVWRGLANAEWSLGNTTLRMRSTYGGGGFGRGSLRWIRDAAYRSGQVGAERLVHDAAGAMGVRARDLVDEIVYVADAESPIFVVDKGRCIIALNRAAVFSRDESLRLLKAAHELGHAQVFAAGGMGLSYNTEEVLVESMARAAVGSGLSSAAARNSIRYENWFRTKLKMPLLPMP